MSSLKCICSDGTVNVDCPICEVDFPPTKNVYISAERMTELRQQGLAMANDIYIKTKKSCEPRCIKCKCA